MGHAQEYPVMYTSVEGEVAVKGAYGPWSFELFPLLLPLLGVLFFNKLFLFLVVCICYKFLL